MWEIIEQVMYGKEESGEMTERLKEARNDGRK